MLGRLATQCRELMPVQTSQLRPPMIPPSFIKLARALARRPVAVVAGATAITAGVWMAQVRPKKGNLPVSVHRLVLNRGTQMGRELNLVPLCAAESVAQPANTADLSTAHGGPRSD